MILNSLNHYKDNFYPYSGRNSRSEMLDYIKIIKTTTIRQAENIINPLKNPAMLLKTRLWLMMIFGGLLCACYKKDVHLEMLRTSEMTEADSTGLFTNTDSAILVHCAEAFIIPKGITEAGSIPLANVYKCVDEKKDTVLLIDLNIHVSNVDPVKDILGIEVKPSKNFAACRVNMDSASISRLRKYKYKYSSLTFAMED